MNAVLLLCVTLSVQSSFVVDTLPLPTPGAQVFLVGADTDKTADVAVLDKNTLTVYPSKTKTAPLSLQLPSGVSAFDVADIDEDGEAEIVSICGERIQKTELFQQGAATEELFRRPSLLSDTAASPYPRVLVVHRGGHSLIALPQADGIDLLKLDGTIDSHFPCTSQGTPQAPFFRSFAVNGPGPLQWECEQTLRVNPDLPIDLRQSLPDVARQRRGTPAQMVNAAAKPPVNWPWFPLRVRGEDPRRVLYAAAPPRWRDTSLRISSGVPGADQPASTDTSNAPAQDTGIGAAQTYPGVLLLPSEDLPDFNGDGYADVVFWQASLPGAAADSLLQAASGGSWEIRLSVYLFDPEHNAYSSSPVSVIRTSVPIPWFLPWESLLPLRNCVFRDLNGDGRTDCAWSTGENTYSVWLYHDGFSERPDYDCGFPEPPASIEFRVDLNGDGATAIGFRSEKSLFILRWALDPTHYTLPPAGTP